MLIAGVDAHRIEVFDGADDDAVVGLVAHDFHFVFLPAEQRFFDENFVHGRKLDAALGDGFKFFADCKPMPPPVPPSVNAGRMMSGKRADLFRDVAGFVQVVRRAGDGNVEADVEHQFLER